MITLGSRVPSLSLSLSYCCSFAQRAAGELDEEALKVTEQLLGANPDFSTMWNLRRETFVKMKEDK